MTLFQFGCLIALAVIIAPYVCAYIATEQDRARRQAFWDSLEEN